MISVVVPNLNEAKYLKKFLLSLLAQSLSPDLWELIIVDGGSSDGSRMIVDGFQEKHPEISITKLIDERRNIGAVRNRGAGAARGSVMFHTSSDVMLDPWVLSEIYNQFMRDPGLAALTARTKPVSDKILCHVAYQVFDFLRWFFTKLPGSMRKFRPGGNFFVVRSFYFWMVDGFPEVCINEDGLLGMKLDQLLLNSRFRVIFDLSLCVHHHVKRFEERGSVKTILFYLYVVGNMVPMLKPFLYRLESHSADVFKNRSDLRIFK